MDDNNLVPASHSTSVETPTGSISPTLDWFLFGMTAAGAAIVYIALFNASWIGFIVGEVICGSIWIGGSFYKYRHARKARLAATRSGARCLEDKTLPL